MTLLTVKELMALLRVKRSTLYALREQGLPAIRIGRSIRFDRDEVVAWVRSQRLAPGEKLNLGEEARPATELPGRRLAASGTASGSRAGTLPLSRAASRY
ncbi:MAG: helix-turn-helix domain-containing protein [Deltaproteobacteria bacterium]|nr:helix-turn-helix domain-containing protein [Deltaproteobacteria bacterium]MBI2942943.1 helix-turn-helix domain-containing protein [Candidatus Wallbacteria bacterium]